ncbi:hypothetical protein SDC9_59636 [bioreactor metagenome]|uniref:Uncharacterized protein n=1 Tax=bioreactor metagenome TaxID=1076179 RepID=A0A644XAP8_9ZZZZ
MTHGYFIVADASLNFNRKFQQTQIIGNRGSFLSHFFAQHFLRHFIFFHQLVESKGNFNGIQVFTLNVFDKSHLQNSFIIGFADKCRNLCESGHF